jgi:RNA polymerase sigma-70 factor (ECF subfamily)
MCGSDQDADEALLCGLAAGGEDATLSFIRRFQENVYGIAFGVSGDPIEAEEIATSAFKYAVESAHVYDARQCSVDTWVVGLAAKAASEALAACRRNPRGEAASHARGRGFMTALERSRGLDPPTRMRAALMQLPDEQARALVLASMGGLPAEQVALAEDVSIQTAKTRIRAAMQQLRVALSADSGGSDSHQLTGHNGR